MTSTNRVDVGTAPSADHHSARRTPRMTPLSPRTYPLGLGTLAIGTSAYSITGLLPAMSANLDTSPAIAGQLLTVFAVTCALTGPPIAAATRQWKRRWLLATALAVTGIGNTLAAVATNVATLFAARIVTGLGAAVYTAGAAAIAVHLNKPEHRARAMAIVFGGLTLALLLGVPAVMAVSASLGYQNTFWLVAALCALGGLGVVLTVPAVASPPQTTLIQRLSVAADRRVLVVLGTALLASMSSFAVYTYITAVLAHAAELPNGIATMLLVSYGIGAVAGNVLSGRATDQHGPRRVLLCAAIACAMLLFLLPITATTVTGAAATLAAWGCAFWSMNPPLNAWLVRLAPTQTNLLMPLLGSAIYLGMGLGSLVGGVAVALLGLGPLAPIAGALSAAAVAILLTRAARTSGDGTNADIDQDAPSSSSMRDRTMT